MSSSQTHQQSTEPIATFKKRGKSKYHKKSKTPSSSDSDSDNSTEHETGYEFTRKRKRLRTIQASGNTNPTSEGDVQPTKFSADKGLANAATFIAKNENSFKRVLGPIKAPTKLRTITVTDFAPDVCKDYKQTGFCGFGDSCKYLHAREDYKHGWQLDREWENVTKGKNVSGGIKVASADRDAEDKESDDDATGTDDIPFACIICKESYRDPIVTKCRHYFCEICALKRYRKNPSCAACGSATGGVFNVAKNLKKLIEKKKENPVESHVPDD